MKYGFLSAHGYDPGPSQRPYLAGAISGLLATIPAIAVLMAFGSLAVESEILGLSRAVTLAVGCVVMSAAGAAYARFFGRAANAVRGGWLFGMSFGFALWAAGGVLVLPLLSGGRAAAGEAALGNDRRALCLDHVAERPAAAASRGHHAAAEPRSKVELRVTVVLAGRDAALPSEAQPLEAVEHAIDHPDLVVRREREPAREVRDEPAALVVAHRAPPWPNRAIARSYISRAVDVLASTAVRVVWHLRLS